jgi:hypothetical protein
MTAACQRLGHIRLIDDGFCFALCQHVLRQAVFQTRQFQVGRHVVGHKSIASQPLKPTSQWQQAVVLVTERQRLAERVASLPEIDNLERRLVSAMERTDGLVEVSASTAEFIEQLLASVGTVASASNVDRKGSAELILTVRSTRESLANASERLADVQRRLAEIRQKRRIDVNLSEITKLSLDIVVKLDIVQEQIVTS